MIYSFIKKAETQPDLSDAIEYLKKPLTILEELQYKIQNFSINNKVSSVNQDFILQIDKIINYFLPNLFNNYTQLSLEYRNNTFLKSIDGKNMTGKDILLYDLGKVINEIYNVEKQFNESNKIHLLANNRIISNLTNNNSTEIELENKFNYDTFVNNSEFIFTKQIEVEPNEILPDEKDTESTGINISLIEIVLMLGLFASIIGGVLATYSNISKNQIYSGNITTVQNIITDTKSLFQSSNSYTGLSNSLLISAHAINLENIKILNNHIITQNNWGIDVFENKNRNKSFTIRIFNIDQQSCMMLEKDFNPFLDVESINSCNKDLNTVTLNIE